MSEMSPLSDIVGDNKEHWYPPKFEAAVVQHGMRTWNDPKGNLKDLERDGEWHPVVLRLLFMFAHKLYVRVDGIVVLFARISDLDWFVAPRHHGYWQIVRGCVPKMESPLDIMNLRNQEYVMVDIRGPSVEHIEIGSGRPGEGFSIVLGDIEYVCQVGPVVQACAVDSRLKLLIHERFAKVMSKDFLNADYYEENRSYAVWSRMKHKSQAEWLKSQADHLTWFAPGDGNGLIYETLSNVVSTDIFPMCPGVKHDSMLRTLRSLHNAIKLTDTVPNCGLILSYVSSFLGSVEWDLINRLTCPVVIMDVRPIVRGRITNILGYGITSTELSFTPFITREDSQLYGGQFSENLLLQENLEIVDFNSAVFYVARMRPMYEFCVQDESIIQSLKLTTIAHKIQSGIPLVMNFDQVVTSKAPTYYVQAGRVFSSDCVEEVELSYTNFFDTRTIYLLLLAQDIPPDHPALRVYGSYMLAVAPFEVIYDHMFAVSNPCDSRSRRSIVFGDDIRRDKFAYCVERRVGVKIFSPHFELCATSCDLITALRSISPNHTRELLKLLGFSGPDIVILYTDSKTWSDDVRVLSYKYNSAFHDLVYGGHSPKSNDSLPKAVPVKTASKPHKQFDKPKNTNGQMRNNGSSKQSGRWEEKGRPPNSKTSVTTTVKSTVSPNGLDVSIRVDVNLKTKAYKVKKRDC
jgi:hypothetical protein